MTAHTVPPGDGAAALPVAGLLAEADALAGSDPHAAMTLYARVLAADPVNLHAHNALERLGAPGSFGRWMGIDCVIHPEDDIFRFFASYPDSRHPIRDYLADGWRTLAELMLVLERIGRPLLGMDSVLEFASGYGRFTRHLARVLPGKVTCADVMPGAADFLRDRFGVAAFDSAHDPAAVAFPGRFELVFVLSLFTHLPLHAWGPWLRALAGAVAPGGVLLFSVHNEAAGLEAGVSYGSDGTWFLPSSESSSLDGGTYGTIFTTRAVVEAEVRAAFGSAPHLHQPLAFWSGQDAVVVLP
jgi:SAM-dependent methyltransferase